MVYSNKRTLIGYYSVDSIYCVGNVDLEYRCSESRIT